jgi:hypothetical protein
MARSLLKAALVAVVVPLGASAGVAQFNPFGTIFGSPPPRPPGSVPGGRQQIGTPPPAQSVPAPGNQPPNYPPPNNPQAGYPPPGGPYGGVQSQPLPPPPGASQANQGPGPLNGLPPGQRQPRGTPQPFDPANPPGDEVIAEPPTQKITNTAALFSGLDKITGRIINFDVTIGETVQFGALQLTPRACYTRPPTETANTDAFVEVDEVTLQGEVRRIFNGWMFAASPGLHAVEHPIYDLWLTDCKGPVVAAAQPAAADPPAAAAPRTPARPQPKQQPQRQPSPPPQQPLQTFGR